jgi:hypothetical protein
MLPRPLVLVAMSRPWWRGEIAGVTICLRAATNTDTSGLTDEEAECLYHNVLAPHIDRFQRKSMSRLENCYVSTGHGKRQVCVCHVGSQVQIFPEKPNVAIAIPSRQGG